jgi:uncharacterized membrane protein YkoI
MPYNRTMSRSLATLLLAAALVTPAALAASGSALPPEPATAATRAEGLTLDEAVARAEKKYSARVVRAEEKTSDGRRTYRIRLLSDDGRVFDVTVDAATGQED